MAAGAQLPPEILLDQLLLRAERLVEADDLDAAVVAMDEAFALGAEHALEPPPDLRFEHARVAFAVGLLEAAKASVTEYLTVAGRQGEFYGDAVGLLEDVERILERRDAPECKPEPDDSGCWMELADQPGCYVWNPNPQPDETATWTGKCSAGFAQGFGVLTWTTDDEAEHEGSRRYGQPHGQSVIRGSSGWLDEGPFRFGKQHGAWVERTSDGAVLEGPYVDGEENGHWILRSASGAVHEGPFVDGKRNGRWVDKDADGDVGEGPYVDGERNGHWVQRFTDGNTGEGSFVNGKRRGRWIWRYRDGQEESGPYVDGKRHGRWRVRPPDGETFYATYVRGVRQEP